MKVFRLEMGSQNSYFLRDFQHCLDIKNKMHNYEEGFLRNQISNIGFHVFEKSPDNLQSSSPAL